MNAENKNPSLFAHLDLGADGNWRSSLTKPEISTWYSTLNRSTLTPPNYVFPVAWTILYGIIGACGWSIWGICISQAKYYQNLIRDSAHFKLELDSFVFPLPLNWTFPHSFGAHGYSCRNDN